MVRMLVQFIGLIAMVMPSSVIACIVAVQRESSDILRADVVVVGRIVDYEIIRDEEFREQRLANPDLSDDLREFYTSPDENVLSDYARFGIRVDEVLKGEATDRLVATWQNSTFGEPKEMPDGRYLIGLQDFSSPSPPLRGPSGYVPARPEPQSLVVLQAPCAGPFIIPEDSDDFDYMKAILRGETPPERDASFERTPVAPSTEDLAEREAKPESASHWYWPLLLAFAIGIAAFVGILKWKPKED